MTDFDRYTDKIKKISAKVPLIKKAVTVVSVIIAVIAAAFIVCAFMKGSFISDIKCESVVYGEKISPSVKAFMSDVSFTYSKKGSTERTETPPVLAGDYTVYAVSEASFGKKKEVKCDFTIRQREISLNFDEIELTFGDSKEIVFDADNLAYEDRSVPSNSDEISRLEPGKTVIQVNKDDITILSKDDTDVTDSYIIKNRSEVSVTVSKRDITVALSDVRAEYDGLPHRCDDYAVTEGTPAEGHTVSVTTCGELTEIGTAIAEISEISVSDSDGKDVTAFYNITLLPGSIEITKRELYISIASYSKVYDGSPLSAENPEFHIEKGSLLSGDVLNITCEGSAVFAGTAENRLADRTVTNGGTDRSDLYEIYAESGLLTVDRRPITIESESYSGEFDGMTRTFNSCTLVSGSLAEGDVINGLMYTTFVRDVCDTDNVIKAGIFNPSIQTDTTDSYDISYIYGKIVITPMKVTLKARVLNDDFGEELYFTGHFFQNVSLTPVGYNKIPFDHNIGAYLLTNILYPGEYEPEFSFFAYDSMGNDVSFDYDPTIIFETAIVEKRDAVITSGTSISEYYDGIVLTCHDFYTDFDSFAFEFDINYTSQLTEIGEIDNEFTVDKITLYGEDVTDCFNITREFGQLIIVEKENHGQEEKYDINMKGDTIMQSSGSDISGIKLFRVYSDISGTLYLKSNSVGDYDSLNRWSDAGIFDADIAGFRLNPIQFSAYWALNAGFTQHYAEISSLDGEPFDSTLVPYYSLGYKADTQNDIFVLFTGKSSYSFDFCNPSLEAFLKSYEKGSIYPDLTEEEKLYEEYVHKYYLNVPYSTRIAIENYIYTNIDPESDTLITDIAEFVRGCAKYTKSFREIPDGVDSVAFFLLESKEGICEHYAAAATVIYRMFGIPARYTVGYLVNTTAGQWTDVTAAQAHAWTEIYLDGIGWVKVEVTGSDGESDFPETGESGEETGENGDGEDGEQSKEGDKGEEKAKSFLRGETEIEAVPETVIKYYDGTPVFCCNSSVLSGTLVSGDVLQIIGNSEDIYVGEYTLEPSSYVILDKNGEDVTDQYKNVTVGDGKVYILPAPLSVDGQIDFTCVFGYNTDNIRWTALGEEADINPSYSVLPEENLLLQNGYIWTDNPGIYSLIAKPESFDINGDGVSEFDVSDYNIKVIARSLSNLQNEKGSVEDAINYGRIDLSFEGRTEMVKDRNGTEYNRIVIRMDSLTSDYTGAIVKCDSYTIITGALREGDVLTVHGSGASRFAGTYINNCDRISVIAPDGSDVTSSYIICAYSGTLEIKSAVLEKKMSRRLNLWNSFLTDDVMNGLWDSSSSWTADFTSGESLFIRKGDALFVRRTGRAAFTATSGLDLNGDGIPEYVMKTDVSVTNRIPAFVIVLFIAAIIIPAGIFIFRKVRW